MPNTTYNGWTNYETWLVNLWLDNDGYYEVCEHRSNDAYQLGQMIRADVEEMQPELKGDWRRRGDEWVFIADGRRESRAIPILLSRLKRQRCEWQERVEVDIDGTEWLIINGHRPEKKQRKVTTFLKK